MQQAEALKDELPHLYEQSILPETPDINKINGLLIQMREQVYETYS